MKTTFLNGNFIKDVYTTQLEGFTSKDGNKVCNLQRSIYGLKQASSFGNRVEFMLCSWVVSNFARSNFLETQGFFSSNAYSVFSGVPTLDVTLLCFNVCLTSRGSFVGEGSSSVFCSVFCFKKKLYW